MSESAAPEITPEITPEARRRHTRHLISISATVFGVMTFMDLLDEQRAGTLGTGLWVEVGINAVVMVVVLLALLGLRRTGLGWLQPEPGTDMDREQREEVAWALRPGGVVAPEHRANTVEMARYLRRYRWAPWFWLAVGFVDSHAYVNTIGAERWFYGVFAVIGLGMGFYYLFALRKARAILESGGQPLA